MNRKRVLVVICFLLFTAMWDAIGQERERVLIVAKGIDLPSERLVETFVDDFHDALLNATNRRYEIRNGRDVFEAMRQEHLQLQSDGFIEDDELARIGHEIGARYVFGIVVEKDPIDKDYYFRAKVIEVERNGVPWSARYPIEIEGDKKVLELTRYNRQSVALMLIERLGFLSPEEQSAWHDRVVEMKKQQSTSDAVAKELAIREQEEQFRRERRSLSQARIRAIYKEHFAPINSVVWYHGYAPRGFRTAVQINIKFLSLGIGTSVGGDKYFPIDDSGSYYSQYDLAAFTFNFAVGVNFKYFGFSLLPEIYFLRKPAGLYNTSGEERYKYIENRYSRALMTLAPSIHFQVPYNLNNPSWGIFGRVGYSFAPAISYNPGFSFEIGLIGGFW